MLYLNTKLISNTNPVMKKHVRLYGALAFNDDTSSKKG